jgi:uncharacterized membrane protein
MKRIASIDITRGIVMIIMALDHVRDLMHVNSITQSPTNLETTTPILFFTRWITYLCAPTFVFLAGTSAYVSYRKTNNVKQSRNFLLKRGLYLVLLDLIVVNFALFFDIGYHTILFEVIATIGFGFIVLGLLLNAPAKIVGIAGLIIIFCHNLTSYLPLADNSIVKTIVVLLFNTGGFPVLSSKVFVIGYPPIPWLGIMLVGFASGKFFEIASEKRKRLFTKIGVSALVLFIAIRSINIYGDTARWASQKTPLLTFLSFMNVTKYPPSLLFCLVTLGIMFLMLAITEDTKSKVLRVASVYGKVPLFYFLIHFFLIHLIMLGLMFLQGISWPQMDFTSGTFGRPKGIQSGVPLWVIYMIWIGVVAMLYKPCFWFGKYKATHTHSWLKYI